MGASADIAQIISCIYDQNWFDIFMKHLNLYFNSHKLHYISI